MKKKKTIVIKNPKLRRIRDNLRRLFIEWKRRQWNDFNDEYQKIHYDQNGKVRHPTGYSYEEKMKVKRLHREMKKLDDIIRGSICKCIVCGASSKDMTYNPVEKVWFCIDCYKINQEHYKDTDQAYLYP